MSKHAHTPVCIFVQVEEDGEGKKRRERSRGDCNKEPLIV